MALLTDISPGQIVSSPKLVESFSNGELRESHSIWGIRKVGAGDDDDFEGVETIDSLDALLTHKLPFPQIKKKNLSTPVDGKPDSVRVITRVLTDARINRIGKTNSWTLDLTYSPATEDNIPPLSKPILVVPTYESNSTETDKYYELDGDEPNEPLDLVNTAKLPIKTDFETTTGRLLVSKTFAELPDLKPYLKKLNSATFLGYPKRTLLLTTVNPSIEYYKNPLIFGEEKYYNLDFEFYFELDARTDEYLELKSNILSTSTYQHTLYATKGSTGLTIDEDEIEQIVLGKGKD